MQRVKGRRGFTLIELIVVVVLIGILSATIIPRVTIIRDKVRVSATEADVNCIRKALGLFNADYSTYNVINKASNGEECIITDYKVFADNVVDLAGMPYMTLPDMSNFASFSYKGNTSAYIVKVQAKDSHRSEVVGNPDGACYSDYRKDKKVSSHSTLTPQTDTQKEEVKL